MKNFDKVMSETTDLELYKILNQKQHSYTPEALQSADKEFNSRNFSDQEIEEFKEIINQENKKKAETKKKNNDLEKTIRSSINLVIPTQKDSLEKSILSLTLFLSLVYVYFLISDFQELIWVIQEMNLWTIYSVLPFILFPLGFYGLWKGKGYGWDIIIGFLTHFTILAIHQLYREHIYFGDSQEGGLYILLDNIEDLFPRTPIGFIILNIIVFTGIIIFLNRPKVLKYYSVKRFNSYLYISVVAIITTIFTIYLFD